MLIGRYFFYKHSVWTAKIFPQSEKLAHMDVKKNVNANGLSDDSNKACEVDLGSYCLNESKQPQSQKKRIKLE